MRVLKRRNPMFNTSLFDEKTFYKQFTKDLLRCENEVVIESPFIASGRIEKLIPIFEKLIARGVKVNIVTRMPKKHMGDMKLQAEEAIQYFERLEIQVFVTSNNHHRKLAIVDRHILWEGSLNILSQSNSREIMRRTEGDNHAQEMFNFLKLSKFYLVFMQY